jgi:hypothetical protein
MENTSCTTLPSDLFHDNNALPNYTWDEVTRILQVSVATISRFGEQIFVEYQKSLYGLVHPQDITQRERRIQEYLAKANLTQEQIENITEPEKVF